jgi:hypothetical protein
VRLDELAKADFEASDFVFNRCVLDYLGGLECILEREPLGRLRGDQVIAYRHDCSSMPWTPTANTST